MDSITYRTKLSLGGGGFLFAMMLLYILHYPFYALPNTLSLFAPDFAFPRLPETLDRVLLVGFILAFLAYPIWPFRRFWLFQGGSADSFLRLDKLGLIYSAFGREQKWHWSELSGVERCRRSIAIALPDDERARGLAHWWDRLTSKGPRLVIRNDYVIPLEDLAAELKRHLAAAEEEGTRKVRRDAPLMFHQQQASVELVGPPVYMAVWIVPLLMVALILFFRDPGIPRDALLLLIILGFLVLLVGALMGLAVFVVGKRANCLSLDRQGLRYTRRGLALAWPWRELSAFEIRKTPSETWLWQGVTDRVIAFTALGDRQAPPGGLEKVFKVTGPDSYAILDHYGSSLDEIVAKLNEYREGALASGERSARG